MADIVSPAVRRRMMAGIRAKNTKPELLFRRALHKRGFRYRLYSKGLPGKPDMVFPRFRAVIFIHGCFWHGHRCHLFKWPSTHPDFWLVKIEGNRKRDKRNLESLKASGWRVLTLWECAVKGRGKLPEETLFKAVETWLTKGNEYFELKGLSDDPC